MHVVRFGGFEVDLTAGQLRKCCIRMRLRDPPFQVLAALLERPSQVVTRDELRRRLWHTEVFVDFDNGLNIAVARLRTVLGDSARHPRFIETLPKRGHRFIGRISSPLPASDAVPPRGARFQRAILPVGTQVQSSAIGCRGREFAVGDEQHKALSNE